MTINEKKVDDILILEFNGTLEIDYDLYEKQIQELIKNDKQVLINCKNLLYTNSLGLRLLLRIYKQLLHKEGKLIFCNLNQNIKDVFLITGFMEIFEVYNSQDEAIKHFKK
jgi:anti-sigma B factor antagonist